MVDKKIRLCVSGVTLAWCLTSAFAHDHFSLSATLTPTTNKLEMRIITARSTALVLATGDGNSISFPLSQFGRYRKSLVDLASSLYTISADGLALVLKTEAVTLTKDNDVEFVVTCEKPSAGKLFIRGNKVGKLSKTFITWIVLQSETRKILASGAINTDQPTFEFEASVFAVPKKESLPN